MRTKKQIEKMMIGMLLGGGCLLSSCHSVYMSAEDRLQGDYQEAVAEVELETVEELTAFAYNDVSVIPYTVENICPASVQFQRRLLRRRGRLSAWGSFLCPLGQGVLFDERTWRFAKPCL